MLWTILLTEERIDELNILIGEREFEIKKAIEDRDHDLVSALDRQRELFITEVDYLNGQLEIAKKVAESTPPIESERIAA